MSVSELFQQLQQIQGFRIRCLIPDLPSANELLPWLEEIDRHAWYSNFGPLVQRYETALGELTGARGLGGEAVTLSSGTAALKLGIAALDLPPGSRILLPAYTFPATLLVVQELGHLPLLADVDATRWVLTPGIARQCQTKMPCDLVLPVAALGASLPVEEWDAFTRDTGVPVLIDAAAALGKQRVGRTTAVAYSLHATKPLGLGEGGVFASSDAARCERVRRLSNFGFERGLVVQGGSNAKLSEYAAAVGLAQLARHKQIVEQRAKLWAAYRATLGGIEGLRLQELAHEPAMLVASFAGGKAAAATSLAAAGIETRRWYLPPLHRHPAFAQVSILGPLPVTAGLEREALGLPFHNRLSTEDLAAVGETLRQMNHSRMRP